MASHPNESLQNRHTLYLGETGSGKTQALKQNPEAANKGGGWVAWDTARTYKKVVRVDNLSDFRRRLIAGIKSGRGYRLALTPADLNQTAAYHEEFSRIVWAALSGRRRLVLVDEEIAGFASGPGKADRYHALLLNQGRKFGLCYHGTSQYPQEVPKTVYRNCKVIWLGGGDQHAFRNAAQRLGVTGAEVEKLQPLEFFRYDRAAAERLKKVKLRYKKV